MRTILERARADVARFWAELLLERHIRGLEIEARYTGELLAFHARRAAEINVALVRLKRERALLRVRGHQPSLTLLNGSRR